MQLPPQQARPAPHAGFAPHWQAPSTQVSPAAQAGSQSGAPQTPALHTSPAPQALPQAPQLARSVWVSTQPAPQQLCPSEHAAPPAHSHSIVSTLQLSPAAQGGMQGSSTQAPSMQPCVAVQATPQPPQ